MLETLQNIPLWISQHFYALTQLQQIFFLLVAGFMTANMLLYFVTRGKEFAIVGLSAVLFLVPFVRFV